MKLASNATQFLPCTCGHLDPSAQGEPCEICMGSSFQADGESLDGGEFRFDTAYFEAWEAHQHQLEQAA